MSAWRLASQSPSCRRVTPLSPPFSAWPKFAGIALIEISRERLELLKEELQGISDVSVIVETTDTQDSDAGSLGYQLNIVGLDRQGILQEVTNELSRNSINVIDLCFVY